jgi:hypothetical protein
MNKRIEKLFDQAKIECSKMGSKPAIAVGLDELEKFAELIVRECADIADINAHQHEPPGSYVRQHFGVK